MNKHIRDHSPLLSRRQRWKIEKPRQREIKAPHETSKDEFFATHHAQFELKGGMFCDMDAMGFAKGGHFIEIAVKPKPDVEPMPEVDLIKIGKHLKETLKKQHKQYGIDHDHTMRKAQGFSFHADPPPPHAGDSMQQRLEHIYDDVRAVCRTMREQHHQRNGSRR